MKKILIVLVLFLIVAGCQNKGFSSKHFGETDGNVYRNEAFGFQYTAPKHYRVHTQDELKSIDDSATNLSLAEDDNKIRTLFAMDGDNAVSMHIKAELINKQWSEERYLEELIKRGQQDQSIQYQFGERYEMVVSDRPVLATKVVIPDISMELLLLIHKNDGVMLTVVIAAPQLTEDVIGEVVTGFKTINNDQGASNE